jgi:hypothetical protein
VYDLLRNRNIVSKKNQTIKETPPLIRGPTTTGLQPPARSQIIRPRRPEDGFDKPRQWEGLSHRTRVTRLDLSQDEGGVAAVRGSTWTEIPAAAAAVGIADKKQDNAMLVVHMNIAVKGKCHDHASRDLRQGNVDFVSPSMIEFTTTRQSEFQDM